MGGWAYLVCYLLWFIFLTNTCEIRNIYNNDATVGGEKSFFFTFLDTQTSGKSFTMTCVMVMAVWRCKGLTKRTAGLQMGKNKGPYSSIYLYVWYVLYVYIFILFTPYVYWKCGWVPCEFQNEDISLNTHTTLNIRYSTRWQYWNKNNTTIRSISYPKMFMSWIKSDAMHKIWNKIAKSPREQCIVSCFKYCFQREQYSTFEDVRNKFYILKFIVILI
jgi:hypothetical protein